MTLKRTKPLKKGAELARNSSRSGTRTAITRKIPLGLGTASPRKAPKDTGPDRATRGLVLARDNWQCIGCGKPVGGACTWWSIQHRVARGVGGGNSLPNLILLCGSATSPGCHFEAERRSAESHAKGYWLRSDEDPRLVPVMLHGEQGGVLVWLDNSGGYSPAPPEAGAA